MKRALVTNSHDAFFRFIFPLFESGWLAGRLVEGSVVVTQSAKVKTNRIAHTSFNKKTILDMDYVLFYRQTITAI